MNPFKNAPAFFQSLFTGFFLNFVRGTAILVGVILVLALAVKVLLWTLPLLLPERLAYFVHDLAGDDYGRYEIARYDGETISSEADFGRADDRAIARWTAQNLGWPARDAVPSKLVSFVYPESDYGYFSIPGEKIQPITVPAIYLRIGQLSRSITQQRMLLSERVAGAQRLEARCKWITVLIGLITTVLVALNSSELFKDQPRTSMAVRLGALSFPALGTAAAALLAFYDPSGTLARLNQTTTGLQQLHGHMATGLWAHAGPKDDVSADEKLNDRVAAWAQRYQEVVSASAENRSSSEPGSGQPKDGNNNSSPPANTPPTQRGTTPPAAPTVASEGGRK